MNFTRKNDENMKLFFTDFLLCPTCEKIGCKLLVQEEFHKPHTTFLVLKFHLFKEILWLSGQGENAQFFKILAYFAMPIFSS